LTGLVGIPLNRADHLSAVVTSRQNHLLRDEWGNLLSLILIARTVHTPIQGTNRGWLRIIHAMVDGLQRPQVCKNSRQVFVRHIAQHDQGIVLLNSWVPTAPVRMALMNMASS
jgi:hypothetical protein